MGSMPSLASQTVLKPQGNGMVKCLGSDTHPVVGRY